MKTKHEETIALLTEIRDLLARNDGRTTMIYPASPGVGFCPNSTNKAGGASFNPGDVLPDGNIYVGQRKDGQHVSIDANPDMEISKWKYDVSWPTREEGKMLWGLYQKKPELFIFKNYKAIWLSEVHADGSGYAWDQWFAGGNQFYDHRSSELSVRAVRRFKSFNHLIIPSSKDVLEALENSRVSELASIIQLAESQGVYNWEKARGILCKDFLPEIVSAAPTVDAAELEKQELVEVLRIADKFLSKYIKYRHNESAISIIRTAIIKHQSKAAIAEIHKEEKDA